MMKTLVTLLCVLSLLSADVLAKSSSSSGRASSFGSRSSSGSSFKSSSSAFGSAAKATSKSSGSSYSFGSSSKPSALFPAGTKSAAAPKPAPKLYEAFKAKNATLTPPSQKVIAADISHIFDRNTRTQRKTSYYSGYTPTPAYQPIIVQHSNYGMWDAMMMWSILDNMGDRQMYYNHQSEPAFQQWRQDANSLCQQGNQEICQKLASLDADVQQLKAKGVKEDISYVTPGVDPNIYTASGVDLNALTEVKICTGTPSSDYTRFTNRMAELTKLKIKVINTNGSVDNLLKMADGTCDMAWTQPDAVTSDELVTALKLDTPEAGFLICNKDSGITNAKQLTNKNTIYVGSDQTGSKFTLTNFTRELDGFKSAVVKDSEPTIAASTKIGQEKDSCLFVVDTWNAPYLTQLDKEGKSVLVEVDQRIKGYNIGVVNKSHYSNLDDRLHWWNGGIVVPVMTPVLVTTKTFIQSNPVMYYDVMQLNRNALATELK